MSILATIGGAQPDRQEFIVKGTKSSRRVTDFHKDAISDGDDFIAARETPKDPRAISLKAQLDDLLRRMRQRRNLDGFFQTLLDAPRSEALHGLGDFRTVVVRAVQVRPDVAQRHGEVAGAGLAQQRLEGFSGNFQQYARLAGLDQQTGHLQQAFFVQAGRTGQRRQTGQAAASTASAAKKFMRTRCVENITCNVVAQGVHEFSLYPTAVGSLAAYMHTLLRPSAPLPLWL